MTRMGSEVGSFLWGQVKAALYDLDWVLGGFRLWGQVNDVPGAQDRARGGTMVYEEGSLPWGQGEDVPCAQEGVLWGTREHKAGSPLW